MCGGLPMAPTISTNRVSQYPFRSMLAVDPRVGQRQAYGLAPAEIKVSRKRSACGPSKLS